jgi:hypothetical protein
MGWTNFNWAVVLGLVVAAASFAMAARAKWNDKFLDDDAEWLLDEQRTSTAVPKIRQTRDELERIEPRGDLETLVA